MAAEQSATIETVANLFRISLAFKAWHACSGTTSRVPKRTNTAAAMDSGAPQQHRTIIGTPAAAQTPPHADPSSGLEQLPHCLGQPHPHLNPHHVPHHRQHCDLSTCQEQEGVLLLLPQALHPQRMVQAHQTSH
eukprot:353525-Rhodomonas_salina.1